MDYNLVPTTVFTPVEYSCCGYSEEKAMEVLGAEGILVYHSAFKPLEWVLTHETKPLCYCKVIVDKSD